jgi:poly-gamma-glutamate synthesis protein (capsule biosynthesis protein)
MHVYVFNQFIDATRDEFLDRHIFYNGKYISTELYTARLEDYARPRPMTESERQSFLKRIFDLTAW